MGNGEIDGPDIFGQKGNPASKATPSVSTTTTSSAPKASEKPTSDPTPNTQHEPEEDVPEETAEEDVEEWQVDDELWYAPNQRQKRPESVLARWSVVSKKTRKKEDDVPGPPMYINVVEADSIDPLEEHTGAIPAYTSEVVSNHMDVAVHPTAIAKANFDPGIKEDLLNLVLHKAFSYHKIIVQDYTIGGPLLSVIAGEVAQQTRPKRKPIAPPAAKTVTVQAEPSVVRNVEVIETDNDLEIHATLPVASAKGVDLTLIGKNSLRLLVPNALPKDIALPCDVIEEEYGCKFSKKTRVLKITLHKAMESALD